MLWKFYLGSHQTSLPPACLQGKLWLWSRPLSLTNEELWRIRVGHCIFPIFETFACFSNLQDECMYVSIIWMTKTKKEIMHSKLIETISWLYGKQRAAVEWGWQVGTCFNPLPSCRLAAIAGADLDRWQHPGLNYKLSLVGLPFPSLFLQCPPVRLHCRLFTVPSSWVS